MNAQGSPPTTVLLVEDEALVRMFVADLLREEGGFKVIEAADADEALRVLEATGDTVRVLVSDVEMPGSMDGFTFTRVVHEAWPTIGFVVVSGRMRPQPDELPRGTLFLAKPFGPLALVEAVRSALGPERLAPVDPALPVLPAGIKMDQLHTGIGLAGALAQPLPEPDE